MQILQRMLESGSMQALNRGVASAEVTTFAHGALKQQRIYMYMLAMHDLKQDQHFALKHGCAYGINAPALIA